MKTHNCGELNAKNANQEVILAGWVDTLRVSGKIGFLLLRDRTGLVQVFLDKNLTEKFKDTRRESVVMIKGLVNKRPENQIKKEMKTGDVEIAAKEMELIAEAEPLPIELDENSTTALDKRLDYRFLDTRRNKIQAIFKIRSTIYKALVNFYDKEGFTIINTPKLTTIGLESGAESFVVNYFDKKVVLAQSPQFYKQMFANGGFDRVFEIGPVYRAEKSHTTRHLTEFIGADFEMGFINDENDIMDMAEKMMKYIIEKVKTERKDELILLNIKLNIPQVIPRISIIELKKILADKGKKLTLDDDLDAEAERMIGEYVIKEFGEEFIFVTHYPVKVRPFYHMRSDQKTTRSFDLLFKGVEVCTGAQREHRLNILQEQAKEKGVVIPKIYEDIFRYGAIPHGGIGFGLDRITQRMLNLDNTREAVLLPRDVERVTP